jgi:hypothetical protein
MIIDKAKQQTLTYVTAGLGLVAGLAWNEAIGSMIEYLIPLEKDSIWAKFLYAIIVTVVLVLITDHLARLLRGSADKPERK